MLNLCHNPTQTVFAILILGLATNLIAGRLTTQFYARFVAVAVMAAAAFYALSSSGGIIGTLKCVAESDMNRSSAASSESNTGSN